MDMLKLIGLLALIAGVPCLLVVWLAKKDRED
jgi:hypothetical protein